jgi:hypothetical protein
MSKAAELAALIGSQTALSNRNLIINGAMQVAQRGTSSTSEAYQTVDRFQIDVNATDELAFTQTQSTTSPDGFSNSYGIEVTTAESALAGDEYAYITYRGEAQDFQQLAYGTSDAKKVTLSFYVRSSLTGKYSVLAFTSDSSPVRSNTKSFTVDSANTWERKTITFEADPSGTINNDNGMGFTVSWILAAGTDNAGTPHSGWGEYTATDDFAFSDQVNFIAQTGTFFITGVQLEVGEQATPFEHRSFGDELARCQRYYLQQTTHIQTPTGGSMIVPIYFPTTMRATPTTANVATGSTAGGLTLEQIGGLNTQGAYLQVSSSANSNFRLNRIDEYVAEL